MTYQSRQTGTDGVQHFEFSFVYENDVFNIFKKTKIGKAFCHYKKNKRIEMEIFWRGVTIA